LIGSSAAAAVIPAASSVAATANDNFIVVLPSSATLLCRYRYQLHFHFTIGSLDIPRTLPTRRAGNGDVRLDFFFRRHPFEFDVAGFGMELV
jgi:hypothetical protein